MKKILAFLMTVIFAASAFSVLSTAETFVCGDVDANGIVNSSDLALLRKQLVFADVTTKYSDVNQDGTIDIKDLVRLKRILSGDARVSLRFPVKTITDGVAAVTADATVTFTSSTGTVVNGFCSNGMYIVNTLPNVPGTLTVSQDGYDTVSKPLTVMSDTTAETIELQKSLLIESKGFDLSRQGYNQVTPVLKGANAVFNGLSDKTQYTVSATFSDAADSRKRQGFVFGLGDTSFSMTINYESGTGWGLQSLDGINSWKWWYNFSDNAEMISKYQTAGLKLTVTRNGSLFKVYIGDLLVRSVDIGAGYANQTGAVKIATYDGISDTINVESPVLPVPVSTQVVVKLVENAVKSDAPDACVRFTSSTNVINEGRYTDKGYVLNIVPGTSGTLTVAQNGYDTFTQSLTFAATTRFDTVELQKTTLISNKDFDISKQGYNVVTPAAAACSAVFDGLSDKTQYTVSARFSDCLNVKKRQGFVFGLGGSSFSVTINHEDSYGWGLQTLSGVVDWKWLYNLNDKTDIISKYQTEGIELTVTRNGGTYNVYIDGNKVCTYNDQSAYSLETGDVRLVTYDGINDDIILTQPKLPSPVNVTLPVRTVTGGIISDTQKAVVSFVTVSGKSVSGTCSDKGYIFELVPGTVGTLTASQEGHESYSKSFTVGDSSVVLEAAELQKIIFASQSEFDVSRQGYGEVTPVSKYCNAVYNGLSDQTQYQVSATFSDSLDCKKRQGFTFGLGSEKFAVTINYETSYGFGIQTMDGISEYKWSWLYKFSDKPELLEKYRTAGIKLTVVRNGAWYDIYFDGVLVKTLSLSAGYAQALGDVKLVTYDNISDKIAVTEPVFAEKVSIPVRVRVDGIVSHTSEAVMTFKTNTGAVIDGVYSDGAYKWKALPGTTGTLTVTQDGFSTDTQSLTVSPDMPAVSVELQKIIFVSNNGFNLSRQSYNEIVPAKSFCSAVYGDLSDQTQYTVSAKFSDSQNSKKRQGFVFGLGSTSFSVTINHEDSDGWGLQTLTGVFNWKWLYNLNDKTDIISKYQSEGIVLTVMRNGAHYDVYIDETKVVSTDLAAAYADSLGQVKLVTYDGIADPIIVTPPSVKLANTLSDSEVYNSNLFYRNDLQTACADPAVIYISDTNSRDYGYYYMYATSDATLNVKGFSSWRSKDLNNWELMGTAFYPKTDSWALENLWAPEVMYDETSGKYLMYFSAKYKPNTYYGICLAVADNPCGPFTQYVPEGGSISSSGLFDLDKLYQNLKPTDPDYGKSFTFSNIDVHPWQDPDTGVKYIYFANTTTHNLYGIEMLDWYTPKYDTLKQLTAYGCYTLNGTYGEAVYEVDSVNEGPYMLKHDGKYYLTFSVNSYNSSLYSVIQAVCDSPLGDYRKLTPEEGGVVLSNDNGAWDHVSGPGHHCFVQAGNELMIVYHEHINRTGGGARAVAFDRTVWTTNKNGDTVLYVNGPTWSPQPNIESVSGYRNIAGEAEISATNAINGSTAALNDGLLSLYSGIDFVPEFEAEGGSTVISLKFEDFRKITAVMVYNSKNYSQAFDRIDRIEFDYRRANVCGTVSTGYINNIAFNWDLYLNQATQNTVRPGAAAIVSFDEIEVREIRVIINAKPHEGGDTDAFVLALSEIAVLGK